MRLDHIWISGLTKNLQEVIISNEVETGKQRPFLLKAEKEKKIVYITTWKINGPILDNKFLKTYKMGQK